MSPQCPLPLLHLKGSHQVFTHAFGSPWTVHLRLSPSSVTTITCGTKSGFSTSVSAAPAHLWLEPGARAGCNPSRAEPWQPEPQFESTLTEPARASCAVPYFVFNCLPLTCTFFLLLYHHEPDTSHTTFKHISAATMYSYSYPE